MKNIWKYSIAGIFIVAVVIFLIARITSAKSAEARRFGAALVRVQKPFTELIQDKLNYTGDVLPIVQANI